ncbi:MAG: NIPSNAP family containing protein [Planctomycetota bacterium]|nr:NIPSNAP family containing protein [Planctomycetota bacterium]
MKRREFLGAAAAAGLAVVGSSVTHAAEHAAKQTIELRLYTFASEEKQKAFADFVAKAMVPALNRAGVTPVGVFQAIKGDLPKANLKADGTHLYLLLPHNSAESFVTLADKLAADEAYQKAAPEILDAPRKDPAYAGCETSVMISFDALPKVEIPTKAPSRVMQLRTYQAHNDAKAYRKMQMFSEGGEIKVFRDCGMPPVFGGRALAGAHFPNVTYMLGFEDEAAMGTGWGNFGKSPGWQKLGADATYKDTNPSLIINLVLKPAASSQI